MIRPELPRDAADLAPLPEAFRATLDRGVAELGVSVPKEALRAIETHVRLLLAWNAAINLTSVDDPVAVATRHVLDSLAALPVIGTRAAGRIADIGSGGGFPGLPLAAVLQDAHVTLIESVAKKSRFLEVVAAASGLAGRVEVRTGRSEDVATVDPGAWDVVTVRAVASLDALVELALPLLRVGGRLLAWKGGGIELELAAAARAATALGGSRPRDHRVPNLAGLEGHRIIEVVKVRPTPAGYPRDPARRRRRPW